MIRRQKIRKWRQLAAGALISGSFVGIPGFVSAISNPFELSSLDGSNGFILNGIGEKPAL